MQTEAGKSYRSKSVVGSFSSASEKIMQQSQDTLIYDLKAREFQKGDIVLEAGERFRRILYKFPAFSVEVIRDHFEDGGICEFTRLSAKGKKRLVLLLSGEYDLIVTKEAGWIFRSRHSDMNHYWMPLLPMARNYDSVGRILTEEVLSFTWFESLENETWAAFRGSCDIPFFEFVIWRFPPESDFIEHLCSLTSQERQKVFLWGSHTRYSSPKDLYQNLIHGAIYKNGWNWPQRPWKTAYCETDAHALYVTLHGLWKATGKLIYKLLKTQIVFSVICRQDKKGAWRHGLWTDDLEVHYRLHCSGIHMLAADYEETKDAAVGSALRRAVDYLKTQCEELTVGTWYLHDSLEQSDAAMRKSHVAFQKSRTLGKSTSNMLVLNTHLDALVALNRYEEVTGKRFQGTEIRSGVNATIAVLGLKPAEALYSLLFKAIELTFLPYSVARKLPLPLRALRRMARVRLIPLLPRIKRVFPRLVMPNGYIDRNLSLNEFCFPYFPINVMDLLRFQRRFNLKKVDPIIDNAIGFMRRFGLERCLEDESAAYSLAFWAEAMYLDCFRRPERGYEALAEAVIALTDSGQGLPPSLLGCNPEYIPFTNQVPCLWTENDQILVVNLSVDHDHFEFLLINGTDSLQETRIPNEWKFHKLLDKNNRSISVKGKLNIPPRSWMRLPSNLPSKN